MIDVPVRKLPYLGPKAPKPNSRYHRFETGCSPTTPTCNQCGSFMRKAYKLHNGKRRTIRGKWRCTSCSQRGAVKA